MTPGAVKLILFSTLVLLTQVAWPAEPPVDAKDLPRTKPLEPAAALASFQIRPGFHLEIAAAEPEVVDPVAMCFDENGRLFVVEMRDYSERRDERLGRIRLLEDTDGDGRYEKSTIYAENLAWPTALIAYGGGLFVGCTPDILYLKDTNGDGKADQRQVVFTGFASGMTKLNVQGLLNSFNWGLDNRIHGATGPNGGSITSPLQPRQKALSLRGRDFSFDPCHLGQIQAETGGGQHGLSFDNGGRKFICHNSDHIRLVLYDQRYADQNPHYSMPPPVLSIATDGPAAEVFRISPDEPWRVLRTSWRVNHLVSGPIEGGGRASGYFTSATGITIYRGNAFPAEYMGDAFIADVGSNLIHRKKVIPDGASFKAERARGEEKSEFIASKDLWFRPVQFANAPDGTLYVADMYREVIEHPWSIPESIKAHLDLNSGNDRGRIYRIAPDGFRPSKPPQLGKATANELVAMLAHPNGWHRDTAARLLYERQDASVVPDLEKLLEISPSAFGRLHALAALNGLGALQSRNLERALKDNDADVREHVVKLCEQLWKSLPSDQARATLLNQLAWLVIDSAPRVRFQLALSLGQITDTRRLPLLSELLQRDFTNHWIRAAMLSSASGNESQLFAVASEMKVLRQEPQGRECLCELATILGARNKSNELALVSSFLDQDLEPALLFSMVQAIGTGLERGGSSLANSGLRLEAIFKRAGAIAGDSQQGEAARLQAIQLLGRAGYGEAESNLWPLLASQQPQSLQIAALNSLGRFNTNKVAGELIRRWSEFTPRLRTEALTILLARPERVTELLKAMEQGSIKPAELASTQIQFLKINRDAAIRAKATALLGAEVSAPRQSIVEKFLPALQLTGDLERGRGAFLDRCVSCHRAGSFGSAVGPDFVTVKTAGKEKLLVNIIDPNREVAANYISYLVETRQGASVLGIIAREDGNSVTLRQGAGKEETFLRSDIVSLKSQGLSLMPEGLEMGFDLQRMADLLEFIEKAQPPAK